MVVQEMKTKVARKEETSVLATLAPAERDTRIEAQRKRLQGLLLRGDEEVAHACYDLVLNLLDKDTLVYLGPAKFYTRKTELLQKKPPKELSIDQNSLIIKDKSADHTCSAKTELELVQALRRRALAFDLVGACSYTSSRARHIQRPGRHSPPVLRTEQFPNGLPSLQGTNALRVQAANELCRRTVVMAKLCHANAVFWSIENPGRSYMWLTHDVAEFLQAHPHFDTFFHHCQYGSAGRKLTRLVHNIPTFLALDKLCDNSHEHEPWGHQDHQWATALETAYPWPLCRALAQSLALCMQDLGAICKTPSYALQEASLQSLRAAAYIQPRKHLPPMVSEFACVRASP